MKLYTEEQVREAYNKGRTDWIDEIENNDILSILTPIELPSDIEVGKIVLGNSPLIEHRDSGYFAAGAMKYNKWMKEQILNQNK